MKVYLTSIFYDNSESAFFDRLYLMAIQICLLVSDDLDDHQAISEALSAISANTILLNIIDSQKAVLLLQHKEHQPDRLILDLSMHGIKINSILKAIKNDSKVRRPIILYGTPEAYAMIDADDDLQFFDKEFSYSEIKTFLKKHLI